MNIQEIVDKTVQGTASKEELQELLTTMSAEMQTLKEANPEKYLEILTQLNQAFDALNSDK
jgi:uncharacterized protein YjgD (DUF1641 family)